MSARTTAARPRRKAPARSKPSLAVMVVLTLALIGNTLVWVGLDRLAAVGAAIAGHPLEAAADPLAAVVCVPDGEPVTLRQLDERLRAGAPAW